MSRSFAPVSLRPGGGGFSTVPQVLVLPRLAFRATRLVVGSSWRGAILALCRVELAAEQFLCSGLTRGGALKHLGMWRVLFIAVLCFSLVLSHPRHAQHRAQHHTPRHAQLRAQHAAAVSFNMRFAIFLAAARQHQHIEQPA